MLQRLIFAVLALPIVLTPALAETIYVWPEGGWRIQDAIQIAAPGDTVVCTPGSTTPGQIVSLRFYGKAIVLLGELGSEQTILDGSFNHRGFRIYEGETPAAVIQGFTLRNMEAPDGGAIKIVDSSPTVRDIVILDARCDDDGGAIYIENSSTYAEDILIRRTVAGASGGAIACIQATPTFHRLTVRESSGEGTWDGRGGALYLSNSEVICTESSFLANSAEHGTSIYIDATSSLVLGRGLVAYNWIGDAVLCEAGGTAEIVCCDFYGNGGSNTGGVLEEPVGLAGNFAADPLFCGFELTALPVHGDSPCLPENNACGAFIGNHRDVCPDDLYLIAGTVVNYAGNPIMEVRLAGIPFPVFTGGDGCYSIHFPSGWSGILSPTKGDLVFIPAQREYQDLSEDWLDEDYAAEPDYVIIHVPEDYNTIQMAIDASEAGDSILIAPGTYWGQGIMTSISLARTSPSSGRGLSQHHH